MMFEIQHYASFIAAILVFQAIPGPGTLAILASTARHGVRAGMGAVLGTLAGDLVYMLAAVLGLAAVLTAMPTLFATLRWLGIGYLCWIGIGLLRAAPASAEAAADGRGTARQGFRRAFAVALTNPKAILFFLAFFPLFMAPGAPPLTLLSMMLHVTLLSLAWQTALVLAGNAVARRLAGVPAARMVATRLAGLALVGFGVRLAVDE